MLDESAKIDVQDNKGEIQNNKPSVKEKWSEDGSTSISPVGNQQPADTENISALDHSSDSKDNTDPSKLQENAGTSLDDTDNLSDSVSLNFGSGTYGERVTLPDVKKYVQSIKMPERITSQTQAVNWTYKTLGGVRGFLSRFYGDNGSRDFSMGLLPMDPTKGREMDIDKAVYSRGRVHYPKEAKNKYFQNVAPKSKECAVTH